MDRFFREEHDANTLASDPTVEPRRLWDRRNILVEFSDADFKRNFRFEKPNFLKVVTMVSEKLEKPSQRGTPLSPVLQVAITLAYLANGSFQHVAGVIIGASKNAAHESIHRVLLAFLEQVDGLITLPTEEEMRHSAHDIYQRFGLPNFCLGVDGTFVRLGKKPSLPDLSNDEGIQTVYPQDFWCRKQFYAYNVMIVGDSNLLIREMLVGWAGSTHDARCWRNSGTKPFIEMQRQYTVAADSAYPLSRHLMKPFLNPQSQKETTFNKKLSALRTVMTENIIGILKNRFPILRLGIRTKLATAENIVRVAGMLHNIAMGLKDPLIENEENGEEEEANREENSQEDAQDIGTREAGNLYRNMLVQRYC